jgi:hypothetical protein
MWACRMALHTYMRSPSVGMVTMSLVILYNIRHKFSRRHSRDYHLRNTGRASTKGEHLWDWDWLGKNIQMYIGSWTRVLYDIYFIDFEIYLFIDIWLVFLRTRPKSYQLQIISKCCRNYDSRTVNVAEYYFLLFIILFQSYERKSRREMHMPIGNIHIPKCFWSHHV